MVEKKLTIVQIVPDMNEGGVEMTTSDIAVHLAQKGHRSIVISATGRLVEKLTKGGVEHFDWPGIGKKNFRCLPYIYKLRKLLIEEKVDVLHLRSRLPAWVGWLAWCSLPKKLRPKLYTTFHGFYSINSYSAIMGKGEQVIAVSQSIKEYIVKNYTLTSSQVKIINSCIDEKRFSSEGVSLERIKILREKWNIENVTHPVVLLPGRLTRLKGQDIFIDAVRKIADLNFTALCVGTIPETPYVKELFTKVKDAGLTDKIRFVGHCDDVPAALCLAQLVVSATSTKPEAFGKTVVEAMAMEKPVVATRHGGSLETVEDGVTGWHVTPMDAEDMARALREALANPEEMSIRGVRGRARVLKHFTLKKMCENHLESYLA